MLKRAFPILVLYTDSHATSQVGVSGVMEFNLVDLVSQRDAVRQHLRGMSKTEIVEWLSARGRITQRTSGDCEIFDFESAAGAQAAFFFDGDNLVFFGDNTTFT